MGFVREYATQAPERSAVDTRAGLQILEFGTDWCGHCMAAQPLLHTLLADTRRSTIARSKMEEGGRLAALFASRCGPRSSCCARARNWRARETADA